MSVAKAKFGVGQVIRHKLFAYRGVIVNVDATFEGTEEWYDEVARTRPPKDRPWYRVLVHDSDTETYVAERNLESDGSGEPVIHSDLSEHFDAFRGGRYVSRHAIN